MVYPTQSEEDKYIQRLLEKDANYVSRLSEMYTRYEREAQERIELFMRQSATDDELDIIRANLPVNESDRTRLYRTVEGTSLDYIKDNQRREILYSIGDPDMTRLQLLQNHIHYNTSRLETEHHTILDQFLNDTFKEEYLRQHENIGFTPTAEQFDNIARTIVNESYQGAEWDSRLHHHSQQLRWDLYDHVEAALLSGRSPVDGILHLADEIKNSYTGKKTMSALNQAKMIAITESGRVQTSVQKYTYDKYGVDEYEFIGEPSACSKCKKLMGKRMNVRDMEPGVNANPIHPRCRCSTIPLLSHDEWKRREQLRNP